MLKNYYNDYEIEFYITIIDDTLRNLNEKIEMLENLRKEFFEELKSRGDD